jgi:hypothetical protein
MNIFYQIASLYANNDTNTRKIKEFAQNEYQKQCITKQKKQMLLRILNMETKTENEIIYEIVDRICKNAEKRKQFKKITWNKTLSNVVGYTYSHDEYNRKINPIDKRLFTIPKNIRTLGDFDFDDCYDYNYSNIYVEQISSELEKPFTGIQLKRCETIYNISQI